MKNLTLHYWIHARRIAFFKAKRLSKQHIGQDKQSKRILIGLII